VARKNLVNNYFGYFSGDGVCNAPQASPTSRVN